MSPTLLSNSAFASLNLFPPAPTHLPRPSSRPQQQSRASSRCSNPPTIPARLSSFDQSPDLSYYSELPPSPTASPRSPPSTLLLPLDPSFIRSRISVRSSSMSADMINLGSPLVISGENEAEATPGSVHVGKERLVNWARPFQGDDNQSNVQIFGQSAQRTRRMKKSHSTNSVELAYSSPTPSSSSDDEPLPLTPSPQDMNRSWTIATELNGLGVKGIKHFDAFQADPIMVNLDEIHLDTPPSSISTPVELNSPVLVSITPNTPRRHITPVRLLNSSQSLNTLGAPANLAELRQLQQAAVDFQHEARRPFKLNLPKERRIRRKAVPSVPEEVVDWSQSPGASTSYTLQVASVDGPQPTSGILASSTPDISASPVAFSEPVTPQRRENVGRRFYGNVKATMSMIDVAPRAASLPIFVPPRTASTGHHRSSSTPADHSPTSSVLSARKPSGDTSSDSGDSWDQPTTPTSFKSVTPGGGFAPASTKAKKGGIYGNKSAFLSQLDLGLKRVLEKKDAQEDKKHKRGVSRFLGVK